MSALAIERLVLAIHDASFPSRQDEDLGRGSPYSQGARAFLRFSRDLGFDGLQLGPQGETTLINPSPYDGAIFSRNVSSLALGALERAADPDWRLLAAGLLEPLVARCPPGPPDRARQAYAWQATRKALAQLHDRFAARRAAHPELSSRFERFRERRGRLHAIDGTFEALAAEHGTDDWRLWPGPERGAVDRDLWCPPPGLEEAARARRLALGRSRAREIERHLFGQFVLAEQHALLRESAAREGLALFGDLQIGFSQRDIWSRRALFLGDYAMGAPPSRTNPAGQAWGYPVLDPAQYFAAGGGGRPGPVLAFAAERIGRLLEDFDGIRIDHPHGLVCPWVYDARHPDPALAVGHGARLFCSPGLADHPDLARVAIPRPEQLSSDPGVVRYADDWVRRLDDEQVARYGVLFDSLMGEVAAAGRQAADVVCEVLSTWPYPLRRVMERHGLGRFCVTQKADLMRADDVYRSENAGPRDWIMVGNHDTRPVWLLAEEWHGTAVGTERAAYLAERLMPRSELRPDLARWLAADPRHLCHGMFAELFASRARRVSVFFADLVGSKETYNRPGVVSPENWTLRLSSDFESLYGARREAGAAFDLPLALALAAVSRHAGAGEPERERLRRTGKELWRVARRSLAGTTAGLGALIEAAIPG
ncbi:MAG TPA: 4-alpha-glucanotransferase [Polyangia bacterium]|nr:4-alpha-glucanotransferase [Polyangia bacterium]